MPPKRKKGKGKGKGKKKGGKKKMKKPVKEPTAKQMYQQCLKAKERLQGELNIHAETSRDARKVNSLMRAALDSAESHIAQEQEGNRDVISELTRQYKNTQMNMGLRMQELEVKAQRLEQELADSKIDAEEAKKERDRYRTLSQDLQERLRTIVETMEGTYETILLDAMESMTGHMEELRMEWSRDAGETDDRLVQLCSEFGGRYIDSAMESEWEDLDGEDDDDEEMTTDGDRYGDPVRVNPNKG